MATTVSYEASLRTRKSNSSSNAKSSAACQEFYTNDYNYVGIVHFAGLSQTNKVITAVSLRVTSGRAGYGAGSTKTVYLRKSNYQAASEAGITGMGYCGDALGTFSGSFYDNSTTHVFSGTQLTNVAAYLAAGNNTFCLYNPSPVTSSQGYSTNYMQWESATITVTYEEGVSSPTASSYSVTLGSSVTLYTNRLNTSQTHTFTYLFGNASGTIGTSITTTATWTPPLSLASQIPNATSGTCAISCVTYSSGVMTGTKVIYLTLQVPDTVKPSISAIAISEAVAGLNAQFGSYVQKKSQLFVQITASGSYGSTISSYRTTMDGSTYSGASYTTGTLNTSGYVTMNFTVTDSRGRTGTAVRTIYVTPYSPPTILNFTAARCNAAGTAAQSDGTRAWVTVSATASSVSSKNTMSCTVYYKLKSSTSWLSATTIAHTSYSVAKTNQALPTSIVFNNLSSYDLQVTVADYFSSVSSTASLGTKQVILDILANGTGIAFGKVASYSNAVEVAENFALYAGNRNLSILSAASLGALPTTGGTQTGNLSIQGTLYPSVYLLPTNNGTTNRTVFEGSYVGASSFSAWEDSTGNNRRMLEIRTAAYQASLDQALVLRTVVNGTYSAYRIFHAGMPSPVPVANGGTAASTAKAALTNLGIFYAASLPSTGVDGQICLVPV